MKKQDLKAIFDTARDKQVLVIGDFCLDAYWMADMQRASISLETPRFPRPIVEERYSPGAGGNVAWNLVDLNLKVYGMTLLGDDWRSKLLKQSLQEKGINTQYLKSTSSRVTPAYFKPIIQSKESSQEDARLDFDNYHPPETDSLKELIDEIPRLLQQVDAVVLEDQLEYGLLSNEFLRNSLNEMSARNKIPFVVDSRNRITEYTSMVLKPNKLEASQVLQKPGEFCSSEEKRLKKAAKELYQKSKSPIFITADQDGVFVYNQIGKEKFKRIPTIDISEPYDITGAGDTFMGGLVVSLVGGASPAMAGLIANMASSISIKTVGETGTATPQDVIERFGDFEEIIKHINNPNNSN